jgi:hypothetical protein
LFLFKVGLAVNLTESIMFQPYKLSALVKQPETCKKGHSRLPSEFYVTRIGIDRFSKGLIDGHKDAI